MGEEGALAGWRIGLLGGDWLFGGGKFIFTETGRRYLAVGALADWCSSLRQAGWVETFSYFGVALV